MDYPPPKDTVDETRLTKVPLHPGAVLIRVYDPNAKHKPGSQTFRSFGPLKRFDHHRTASAGSPVVPATDPDRAVYYAALTLSSSVVEVFGEDRVIDRGTFRAVYSTLKHQIVLLDLRGNAAIRAGVAHAIGQIEDANKTQAWARYIYETTKTYGTVDGLLYANSHNGAGAILLYERARPAIVACAQRIRRLAAPAMEVELLRIADATGFALI
jgi:hypothetical protein